MRQKLCYILPEYRIDTHTHLSHIYDFIREISKIFDVYLIIEKGDLPRDGLGCGSVKVLRFGYPPLRFFEVYLLGIRLFFKGYRDFYVHYSFVSAVSVSCAVRILGGRVFYWNAGEPWKYKRIFFREFFERLTYKAISYLVTGTESLKKEYAKHYGVSLEKIRVMPNWVDTRKFQIPNSKFQTNELKNKLQIPNEFKIVLFVHRLSKRKGAHYLPEMINAFKNEKVVFVIVGDGPERASLEFRVSSLELGAQVRLLGWVPNHDLPRYYAIADIFIVPSDEEGFPRVLLEAMAFGVPLVAFNVGGVLEIVPEELKSYVVKSGDIRDFIGRLRHLLKLPAADLDSLKGIEKDWVKNFDMGKSVNRFLEFFNV